MDYLFERFPEMQPTNGPPTLWTINGVGTTAYGRRDYDGETGTYVKTVWLTVVFIPVLPISSYRVADAPNGGWYFLGKVPVSGAARGWSLMLALAAACAVGYAMWSSHTNSPSYQAEQKLERAGALAAEGKLADAARLYREVAEGGTDQAPRAMKAVQDLLDDPALREKGDAVQMAAVYRVAWDLRERPGAVPDLFGHGLKFAEARADDSPQGSLAVLEAVEPAAPGRGADLAARENILRRLLKDRPQDPELLSKLAVAYERGGRRDRCLALLEPHARRLGDTEGARVLGLLLFDSGRHEEAFGLLQPYAEKRLQSLGEAERQFEASLRQEQNRVIELLKSGHAPGFDYRRYKTAGEHEQDTMVQEYLNRELRNSPGLGRGREALAQQGAVVPVALDLGMMRLGRAQRLAEPAARKAELEQAEKTFLAVRGLVGDRPEYRLSLAQVYYWLGRQEEGKKLFDEALKTAGRNPEILLLVASLLRELGAVDESRALSEEAYNHEGLDRRKKQDAALLRALTWKDTDDEIAWLERSDPSLSQVKASLAQARGHKAMSAGKDAEAAAFFREAIDVYAAQPESASSLNNAGLASVARFRAGGDREDLARGVRMLEKAITLKPGDGILVGNVGSLLLYAGLTEVAGDRIDFRTLRRQADQLDLAYLYADRAGREDLVQRVKENATVVRARAQLDRALVLAPNNAALYGQYEGLLYFLRDGDTLASLDRRAAESKPDQASTRQEQRDFWEGKRDEKWRPDAAAAAARGEQTVARARAAGGATFAAAVGTLLRARLTQEALGEAVDADGLVRLAEEADRLAPSVGTRANLQAALLARAAKALSAQEPEFAGMAKRSGRALGGSYLVAVALWRQGPSRKAALANADVRRAVEMVRTSAGQFPEQADEWTWAVLRAAYPGDAARVADALKANLPATSRRALESRLSSGDPAVALRECWALEAAGREADAAAVLRRCAADGTPLPFNMP